MNEHPPYSQEAQSILITAPQGEIITFEQRDELRKRLGPLMLPRGFIAYSLGFLERFYFYVPWEPTLRSTIRAAQICHEMGFTTSADDFITPHPWYEAYEASNKNNTPEH